MNLSRIWNGSMELNQMNKDRQPLNPQPTLGGTISDMLDRLEVRVGKLGMSTPADAAAILTDLDAVNAQIQQLEGKISRKTAEGQFESILAHLRTQAPLFIKSVGGIEALKLLRQKHQPPEENWWWYLDVLLERTSKARRRVVLATALTLIIALGMVILVYQLFLRPDPQVEARYLHQSKARDYIQQGQFDQALGEIDQSLQYAPNDTALLVLKGVIFERQGKQDQAQQIFTQAEQDAPSKENFLLTRSEAYLLVNQPDLALIDAQTVLKLIRNLLKPIWSLARLMRICKIIVKHWMNTARRMMWRMRKTIKETRRLPVCGSPVCCKK